MSTEPQRATTSAVTDFVAELLARLDIETRLLLEGAADGYDEADLCRLLGWPPSRGDEVRELLRIHRRGIIARMRDAGLVPADIIAASRKIGGIRP